MHLGLNICSTTLTLPVTYTFRHSTIMKNSFFYSTDQLNLKRTQSPAADDCKRTHCPGLFLLYLYTAAMYEILTPKVAPALIKLNSQSLQITDAHEHFTYECWQMCSSITLANRLGQKGSTVTPAALIRAFSLSSCKQKTVIVRRICTVPAWYSEYHLWEYHQYTKYIAS